MIEVFSSQIEIFRIILLIALSKLLLTLLINVLFLQNI